MKKHTERERAEEWYFIDQFCDIIQNGGLLDEHDDPNDMSFMPLVRAKHKALRNDIGIQEKPKKGNKCNSTKGYCSKIQKRLPDRTGRGFNRRFASHDMDASPKHTSKQKKTKIIQLMMKK